MISAEEVRRAIEEPVNAVVDALSGLGVDHIEAMPLTAERVWKTLQAARAKK